MGKTATRPPNYFLGTSRSFLKRATLQPRPQLRRTIEGSLESYIGRKDIPRKGAKHRRICPISVGERGHFTTAKIGYAGAAF
jgi:hypothetical protein